MLCYLVKRVTFNIDAMNLFFFLNFFSFERVNRRVLCVYISIFCFSFYRSLYLSHIFFYLENAMSNIDKQRFSSALYFFFLFFILFSIRLSSCCLSCCLSAFLSQPHYNTYITRFTRVTRT